MHKIYIGYNTKKTLPKGRGAVITDRNVNRYWGKEIKKLGLPVYVIPPGERSKTLKTAERIYKALLRFGLDRQSFLVAFGGGVVGDLTGFVAATYMRGISYIQIPTTLMAQVDSSIGGKTGVNLPEGKNLIGCFWQPESVFIDTKFLSTLPKKEMRNGFAEVIKYGVIKDRKLFEYLEKGGRSLPYIVKRCANIKREIVKRDERETKGLRVILNYGHTFGHAIESSNRYKGITHGEAVAIGMKLAAKMSNKCGYLSKRDMIRQINLIDTLVAPKKKPMVLPCIGRGGQSRAKSRDAMRGKPWVSPIEHFIRYDKKAQGGRVVYVLADKIGHVFISA